MTRLHRTFLATAALGALAGAGALTDLTQARVVIPPPEPDPTPEPLPTAVVEDLETASAAAEVIVPGSTTAHGETRLRGAEILPAQAKLAASLAAERGGTARDQIDAARAVTGRALVYLPHIGKRQRDRALARMRKSDA